MEVFLRKRNAIAKVIPLLQMNSEVRMGGFVEVEQNGAPPAY